jgi:chitobiase/beta-hexosaminidase-like protein
LNLFIKAAVVSITWSLLAGCGSSFEWFPEAGTASTSSTAPTTTVPAAADNTAPVTTANPRGKTFSSSFTVALTANEPATIYYTTNGVDPTTTSVNGTNTVPNIPISTTTTLKFFAVDSSGNKEAIKTETYTATGSITVTF